MRWSRSWRGEGECITLTPNLKRFCFFLLHCSHNVFLAPHRCPPWVSLLSDCECLSESALSLTSPAPRPAPNPALTLTQSQRAIAAYVIIAMHLSFIYLFPCSHCFVKEKNKSVFVLKQIAFLNGFLNTQSLTVTHCHSLAAPHRMAWALVSLRLHILNLIAVLITIPPHKGPRCCPALMVPNGLHSARVRFPLGADSACS